MIQFNLLPDVKLEFIKAQRTKRLVVSIATLASIVSIVIFVLLFGIVKGVQQKNLNDLDRDIKARTSKLQNNPDLNKILTIQGQLANLDSLHDAKPIASRLFDFVGQVTPSEVTISNITADFTQNTLSISGAGPSLDSINTYADTLKFTTYTSDKTTSSTKAFSNVVLSGFSRGDSQSTYTLTLSFDPTIFNATDKIKLTVPNTITTRSITEQPTDLFKSTTPPQKGEKQ